MLQSVTRSLPTHLFNRIRGAWLALLLVSLTIVAYSVFTTYLSPRPYYASNLGFDIEHDFVYNSKLIIATGTPDHVLHPGTPIQYLGAGIMAAVGTGIERTQTFLNVGYAVMLLAFVGSLAIFTKIALAKSSFSVAFLALGVSVVWPPLLTFMNYWGGDIFFYSAGLVATAMIWPAIDQNRQLNRRESVVLGLVIGFGLAVKITLAPLALILVITVTAIGIRNRVRASSRIIGWKSSTYLLFREPLLIGTAAAAMFTLTTSPALPRIHQFFAWIYRKWQIDPLLNTRDSLTKFMSDATGSAPLTTGIVAIASLIIVAGLVLSKYRNKNVLTGDRFKTDQQNFSRTGVWILVLSVLFIGVNYGVSSASAVANADGKDPGILLRQLTGIAAVAPILVLCAHRVSAPIFGNIQRVRINQTLINVALITLGMGAILITMTSYGLWRAKDVDSQVNEIAALQNKLNKLAPVGTRIALGEISLTGAPYFHFYGNSAYVADYFEDQLSSDFERYAFIDWGNLRRHRLATIGLEPKDPAVIRNTGVFGVAERMYQSWLRVWPDREPSRDVIFSNDDSLPVSVFAYSDGTVRSGRLGETQLEIYNTIEDLFGEILYRDSLELQDDTWNFAIFRVPG